MKRLLATLVGALALVMVVASPAFACHVDTTCGGTFTVHGDSDHPGLTLNGAGWYKDGVTYQLSPGTYSYLFWQRTGGYALKADYNHKGSVTIVSCPTTTTTAPPTTTTTVPPTTTTTTVVTTTTTTIPKETTTTVPEETTTTTQPEVTTTTEPQATTTTRPVVTTTTVVKRATTTTQAAPTTTQRVVPPSTSSPKQSPKTPLAFTGGSAGTPYVVLLALILIATGVALVLSERKKRAGA